MEQAIIKAYKFIDEHLCDEFSLDEIARFVGYSSYHLLVNLKKLLVKL